MHIRVRADRIGQDVHDDRRQGAGVPGHSAARLQKDLRGGVRAAEEVLVQGVVLHAGAVQRQAHRPAQAWQGGAAAGDQEGQEGDGGGAGSGDAGGGERGGAERDIQEGIGEPARGVDEDER